MNIKMQSTITAWYVARTKPKHEHIAASNLRKQLGLDVFSPHLPLKKFNKRALVSVLEPLFPYYIFVHCRVGEQINQIKHTVGVSQLVQFGDIIPKVANEVIVELRKYFRSSEAAVTNSDVVIGNDVATNFSAFSGVGTFVLKNLPAKKRVQILLGALGRPTLVKVGREAVVFEKSSLVDLVPFLAVPVYQERVLA